MNIIRIALAIVFATLGIVCLGLIPLSMLGPESFATRMDKVYVQPKAEAEADRLIDKGIFTQEQHNEIRGFVRRLYISNIAILYAGIGVGTVALGISLLSVAYSLKTSVKLSILSRRLKAEQTGASDLDH